MGHGYMFIIDGSTPSLLSRPQVSFLLIGLKIERKAYSVPSIVILYYDYILTLHREIRFLWPPHNKQGWFTIACLLNRYIPVLGYLPLVVSYFIKLDFPVRPSSVSHRSTNKSDRMQLYVRVACASRSQNAYSILVARISMYTISGS
jgi:Family of unknown function (DUF6533)